MAIEIKYTEDGVGVELVASGTVFGEQILAALEELQEKSVFQELKYKLINRLGCKKYFVSTKDIRAIAEFDKAAVEMNPALIIALVSPDNKVLQESAEIWHSFAKENVPRSKLFSDRASADAWISVQLQNDSDQR